MSICFSYQRIVLLSSIQKNCFLGKIKNFFQKMSSKRLFLGNKIILAIPYIE
ncbi:unknown protein [Microcystis aeruginosa NIES-843]|uniref:Uncharacterized protein n=1 Tax=Microcystis aeruginosa (strain NIES-843 / IAM M-2473) TaxID=449447 RepID=B0JSL7_MICAN|nr:unknown protein [Microcystis aeruginosa NIES-843]